MLGERDWLRAAARRASAASPALFLLVVGMVLALGALRLDLSDGANRARSRRYRLGELDLPGASTMADVAPALKTPTDLNRNDTRTVADALNGALADCYALYLKTKNFHWHVSGPHFRDYHLMLDDQAAQILGVTDAIAERVRKTGNTTLRSIGDIARRQTISDNDRDVRRAAPRCCRTARRQSQAGREPSARCRTRPRRRKDNATSGIVDEWTDQAEERAWFLFEASRKG